MAPSWTEPRDRRRDPASSGHMLAHAINTRLVCRRTVTIQRACRGTRLSIRGPRVPSCARMKSGAVRSLVCSGQSDLQHSGRFQICRGLPEGSFRCMSACMSTRHRSLCHWHIPSALPGIVERYPRAGWQPSRIVPAADRNALQSKSYNGHARSARRSLRPQQLRIGARHGQVRESAELRGCMADGAS